MNTLKTILSDRRTRLALALVITVILVICGIRVIGQQRDYAQGSTIYADALVVAGIPDMQTSAVQTSAVTKATTTTPAAVQPSTPVSTGTTAVQTTTASSGTTSTAATTAAPVKVLTEADLPALQEINPDVIGWIMIPDTNISYPLLQGTDNDYYLNHTWNNTRNSAGSIFLECMVSPTFADFNTIIYGHRMNNGTMFTGLRKYESLEYLQQHPSVFIRTGDGSVYQYDVYAAYEAAIGEITYGLSINEDSLRDRFIRHGLDSSVVDTGIIPTNDDRVITLVTCTGHGHASRWVVQAVLHTDESDEQSGSQIPDREPDIISTGKIESILQFIPFQTTTTEVSGSEAVDATTSQTTTAAAG